MKKRIIRISRKKLFATEKINNGMLDLINKKIPFAKHIQEIEQNELKNSSVCIDTSGESWFLGYSALSITPQDIGENNYYIGGNISIPPRKVEGIIDDVKVRTVCISTSIDGDKTILVCIDCIGLTNYYVQKIRNEILEFSKTNNIKTVNIFSTHTHSSIDTMGIWSVNFKKIYSNLLDLRNNKNPTPSVDVEYLDYITQKVKESIFQAVTNLEPGKLYYLKIGENSADLIREDFYKKIGFDSNNDVWNKEWEKLLEHELINISTSKLGLYSYIFPKRSPYEFIPCITRMRFEPSDKKQRETIIVNLSAHPYSNGLKIRKKWPANCISGDFPYYMEKIFDENNYNFLFINGAINGIYPKRAATKTSVNTNEKIDKQTETIGCDFARITLIASMSKSEIYSNKTLNPSEKSDAYQTIVKNHNRVIKEIEIKPALFEIKKCILLKCSNPIEQIIGKLNFSQFNAYRIGDDLCLKTEIGFIQMGELLKIALVPGEITAGLFTGKGDMIEKNTLNKSGNKYNCISNIFRGEVTVFGLANDEIGYIIPDDDYCMFYIGNGFLNRKLLGKNYTHYQETFSLGENTASELMKQIESLKDDAIKYIDSKQE